MFIHLPVIAWGGGQVVTAHMTRCIEHSKGNFRHHNFIEPSMLPVPLLESTEKLRDPLPGEERIGMPDSEIEVMVQGEVNASPF